MPSSFSVNGTRHSVRVSPTTTLLEVLRDRLGLTGTKEACGRGECGACTVLVADRAVLACLVLAMRVGDREVVTIEGLAERTAALRAAFADRGAFQCGFCTPGQIVSATALLMEEEQLDEVRVSHWMSGNVCRCTGYRGIVEAIADVARSGGAP